MKPLERIPVAVWGLAIVGMATAAYLPALGAGFVFDDHPFVLGSQGLRGPLWQVWFTDVMPDYWPLTWTSFWVERRLWGESPLGYHVLNVALHAATAVLLWRALTRLRVPGAWLGAAIFSVHPVTVESVAWVSERKNTLSGAIVLLAFLAWLRHRETGNRWMNVVALGLYCLALLAKTSVVAFPVVLLGTIWAAGGRPTRRDWLRVAPFFGAAVVAGAVTVWFQWTKPMAVWWLPERNIAERLAGAGWALLEYQKNAFLPVDLAFVHPGWPVQFGHAAFFLPLAFELALFAILYRWRRGWAGPAFLALGFHALLLAPVLGIVDMAWLKIAPVSNHLQYLALMGPTTLVGWGAARAASNWPTVTRGLAAALLIVLGVATYRRSDAFTDDLALWSNAVRDAPDAAVAHLELAGILLGAGKPEEALRHMDAAGRVARRLEVAHRARSMRALYAGRMDEAIAEARAAVAASPDPFLRRDLGVVLTLAGRPQEAVPVLGGIVANAPEDVDFRVWYARALDRSGRRREALATLGERCRPGDCDAAIEAAIQEIAATPESPAR